MTQLKTLPGDAMRAMMEFDRCRDDPIVWRSMVLAVLLERETMQVRESVYRGRVTVLWVLVLASWGSMAAMIYKLVHP